MNNFALRRGFAVIEPLECRIAPAFAPVMELSGLNGANGFRLDGVVADDHAGTSVSAAGDVNGDGFDDLIIGADGADPGGAYSGAAYVIFGKASGFPASLNLSVLDGSTGFKLSGVAFDDFTGASVSGAGDVNNDGFDDIVIGAPGDSGVTYVVFGKAGGFPANLNLASLDGVTGFRVRGDSFDAAGTSVSSAGDFNDDGFDDIIIGAPQNANIGAAYLVFGRASGFPPDLNAANLNGIDGFKLSGVAPNDQAGASVSGAGDVNGDGFDDVIIGAPSADPAGNLSGASYVVFGKAGGFAPNLNLSTLDGTNGFRIDGAAAGDLAGFAVSGAGNINGDGFADVIIGAYRAPAGIASGAAYVILGKAGGFASTVSLSTLNGNNGFRLTGVTSADDAGAAVSEAGDINDDGFGDLLIGARHASPNGFQSGASYVVFGKPGGFAPDVNLGALDGSNGFKLNGMVAGDSAGDAVSGVGDINGDGADDLVIGAFLADGAANDSGESYVVFGQPTPSPLIVTTTLDVVNPTDGVVSLREAITFANTNSGLDTITFNIPGPGVQTIGPASNLPTITEAVQIDGYSQPGASPNTLPVGNDAVLLIQLTGGGATDGLHLAASGSTVRGLLINGFGGFGIRVEGTGGHTIAGNWIGIDAAGTSAISTSGIVLNSAANLVGGTSPAARNVIPGGTNGAVTVVSGAMNTIAGNYIGTNAQGSASRGAGGLSISGPDTVIGGIIPGSGNVISGAALFFHGGAGAVDGVVQGNYIGLSADGTSALNNAVGIEVHHANNTLIGGPTAAARNVIVVAGRGINLVGDASGGLNYKVQGNYIGLDPTGSTAIFPARASGGGIEINGATGSLIGGPMGEAGNVIANHATGIAIFSANNTIQRNLIGTDATGTVARPNAVGISVGGSPAVTGNVIGGVLGTEGNLISGNIASGISLGAGPVGVTTVRGNLIGVDESGTAPLGNGNGGIIIAGDNQIIGGNTVDDGNLIAFNTGDGIRVESGNGNALRGNLIHSNTGLGIDLAGNGVTQNDVGDGDLGPNGFQNFPVIDSIRLVGPNTEISGSLSSTPNATFFFDLYLSPAKDPSGFGEGASYLGSLAGTTDGSGNAQFIFTVTGSLSGFVTATATKMATQDTSEFSAAVGASALTVTTNNDAVDPNDGLISLREAINFANSNPGLDTITFNIPGAGVQTISVSTELPEISERVVIDGYSQPGASPNNAPNGNNAVILIELRKAAPFGGIDGLFFTSDGNTVRGLAIGGFDSDAIEIRSSGNQIVGNFIGLAADGTTIISNNTGVALGNAPGNFIGGPTPEMRNVISGNATGIAIDGIGASGNLIQGNFIGTDASGTLSRGNSDGIVIMDAADNVIGGATGTVGQGPGNLISGNTAVGGNRHGIVISGGPATGNRIQGNIIGTDITGTVDLGNGLSGIVLDRASLTTIGGSGASDGNVISGNEGHGIVISGPGADLNVIQGNRIGTKADGTGSLGNSQHGVLITSVNTLNNLIGGPSAQEGNIIAFSGGAGISVQVGTSTKIRGNSIHSNFGLGIALGLDGVTPNDPGDGDAGPNNLQNFPVLLSAVRGDPSGVTVTGTLNSTPNSTFTVDFFSSAAADPTGFGEGQLFLGSIDVTTDGSGNASFTFAGATVAAGDVISATATHVVGDTSEFSQVQAVTGGMPAISISDAVGVEGQAGTADQVFNVSLSSSSNSTVQFFFSTVDGTAVGGSDYTPVTNQLVQFAPGETSKVIVVKVLSDVTIEPNETFSVVLSNATNATIARGTGTGTIINDDGGVTTISISDAVGLEGQAGTADQVFNVSLSSSSNSTVQFFFSTVDGTAVGGSDYTPVTNQLVEFAPGETSKVIVVNVLSDVNIEPNETFTVVLSNASNATIARGTGTGTIINDDPGSSSGDDIVFTDGDGDEVTIALSEGTLPPGALVFEPTAEGFFLKSIDFTPDGLAGAGFNGASMSITAKPRAGGDGRVNVGTIDSTGIVLKKLRVDGDVGLIEAGAIGSAKPAIKKLQVVSLGKEQNDLFGGSQAGMLVQGGIGRIKVLTDVLNFAASIGVGQQSGVKQLVVNGMMSGSRFEVGGGFDRLKVGGILENTDFEVGQNFKNVSVAQQMTGGSFVVGGTLNFAIFKQGLKNVAFNAGQSIDTLIVRSDVEASTVHAGTALANFVVGGSLVDSTVSAPGKLLPQKAGDARAFKILGVQEDVVRSQILAGYDRDGMPVNPDAGIGKVVIKGKFEASSIAAGASAGADGFFGNTDDALLIGGNEVVAKIASITVKGAALGTSANPADHFGIVAEELGKVKVGGASLPLSIGARNDLGGFALGGTDDVRAREVD